MLIYCVGIDHPVFCVGEEFRSHFVSLAKLHGKGTSSTRTADTNRRKKLFVYKRGLVSTSFFPLVKTVGLRENTASSPSSSLILRPF